MSQPALHQPDTEAVKDESWLDHIRRNSLSYTGYSYVLGDLTLALHGLANKRPDRAIAGLGWTIGGVEAALYGNAPMEQRFKMAAYDFADYCQSQQLSIPSGSQLNQHLANRPQMGDKIEQFLYRYPSQIFNSIYLLGGLFLVRAGLKQSIPDRWEATSGAISSLGALCGLVLPEKKQKHRTEQERSDSTPLTPNWFLERPLRLTATLYGLQNVTMIKSAMQEYRNPQMTSLSGYKFATVAAYLAGDGFLSLSSKTSDNEMLSQQATDRLLTIAAEVVSAQPPAHRDATLARVSGFLADHPDVPLDLAQLTDALQSRIMEKAAPSHRLSLPASSERFLPALSIPAR